MGQRYQIKIRSDIKNIEMYDVGVRSNVLGAMGIKA